MSDTIVLRKVFALDSNTGQFISSGSVLLTNGFGGTDWTNIFSTLTIAGGPTVGYLPSTLSTTSSLVYINTSSINYLSTSLESQISTLSSAVNSLATTGPITGFQLTSTVDGLGSSGYISSQQLLSTTAGILAAIPGQASTTSTIDGLGSIGYISTQSLTSSIAGLGSLGYISSQTANSTTTGIFNYLTSTYISSGQLTSTINGLGSYGNKYISSLSLTSTVNGLGSSRYVSSTWLDSTVVGILSTTANVRFDNTTTVIVNNGNVYISSAANLLSPRNFVLSSYTVSTGAFGITQNASLYDTPASTNLVFSTVPIHFNAFSSILLSSSRVTLEVYPTIAFSKLASGANGPVMLPISTVLRYGTSIVPNASQTTWLYAGNYQFVTGENNTVDASNIYNTPIKIQIPPSSLFGYDYPYQLVHYMTSSMNNGALQEALHNSNYVAYIPSTNGVFITVQNMSL